MTAADRIRRVPSGSLFQRFLARLVPSRRDVRTSEGGRPPAPSLAGEAEDLTVAQLAAHDLRNLMTVIVACAESMHRHVPLGRADREFSELRRCVHRASMLIRDLMIASGPPSAWRSHVDLNQLIASAVETLAQLVGTKIRMRLRLSPVPVTVIASVLEIERILVNLTLNARDAMPDGGVLTIATAVLNDPPDQAVEDVQAGPQARLTVSDTGGGMPADVKARIFEPFFTTKEMGTGLGLSSVVFTVRQLEGMLSVESQPGGGTRITVQLPLARPRATRPSP